MLKKAALFSLLLFFIANIAKAQFINPIHPDSVKGAINFDYIEKRFGITAPGTANPILYSYLDKWLGTPYRYGGFSIKGVDCSGLTKLIYENVYGVSIARTAIEIVKYVKRLSSDDELKEGDLVFFNTRNNRVSHVGVYLGNNKFIHASTQQGVVVSSLESTYYKRTFLFAGRILGNL